MRNILNGKNETGLSTGNNKDGKQIAKICTEIKKNVCAFSHTVWYIGIYMYMFGCISCKLSPLYYTSK